MRSRPCLALGMAALLGCVDELEVAGPRMNDDPVWLWVGDEAKAPHVPEIAWSSGRVGLTRVLQRLAVLARAALPHASYRPR